MSSTFGTVLKVTTFGESHGKGVGAVLDGCPPRLALQEADIQGQLDRRRPGQSSLTTGRDESDRVTILSGVENGLTLGTPIALLVANRDQKPGDYASMQDIPRPSHADYTYQMKYGIRALSGGGRSSARETIGRVAAGAIAEKFLNETHGIDIVAWVSSVGAVDAGEIDAASVTRRDVDQTPVRSPAKDDAEAMMRAIKEAKEDKDSLGGVISCVCRNVPAGLGEPVFDKLEAALAHAMLSIPATKGFEIGSGFAGMTSSSKRENAWVQRQITAAAFREGFPTASRLSFGWPSNRRPRSDGPREALTSRATKSRWRPKAAMTPVSCPGRCRLLKAWRHWLSGIWCCGSARAGRYLKNASSAQWRRCPAN